MLLNIILILFLLFITYWWASQGLFSSLLHLVVTIVAGAMALCLWEPLASRMLASAVAPMAWAIGLVLPFALFLTLLRLLSDRLIRGNVQHQQIVGWVFGGAFGLISGVLTAGLVIIGLGFMPFTPDLGGVQPLAVSNATGSVGPNPGGGKLWVPVDRWTQGFYNYMSRGAFGTSTPLARYQPDVAQQAHLTRLPLDENASRTAHPDNVEITALLAHPVQVAGMPDTIASTLGDRYQRSGYQLVVLETTWENAGVATTYDKDATARVFWNQVRLVTDADDLEKPVEVYGPVAITQEDVATGRRVYRPWNDAETYAFSTRKEPLVFTFLIPENQTPSFVLIRNTRFDLSDAVPDEPSEPDALVTALGGVPQGGGEEATAAAEPIDPTQALGISKALPWTFAANSADVSIQNNGSGAITGGGGTARGGGRGGARTTVKEFFVPSHQRMLRLQVARGQAQAAFGAALAAAERNQRIWLRDTNGNEWTPNAWVVDKGRGTGGMRLAYGPIDNASTIPTYEMTGNDKLYLYFLVSPGVTIDSYHLGDNIAQDVNIPVPRN
ncbi:MAG: hypothetical protein AAGK09_04575 [Planctomycetota bacterium]